MGITALLLSRVAYEDAYRHALKRKTFGKPLFEGWTGMACREDQPERQGPCGEWWERGDSVAAEAFGELVDCHILIATVFIHF